MTKLFSLFAANAIKLADKFDKLPIAPGSVGKHLIGHTHEKRRLAAKNDAVWAEIEKRRYNSDGTITFLADDLDLSDWDTQQRIEQELHPDSFWLPVAYTLSRVSIKAGFREVQFLLQRATRGWDDSDTWDLGRSHAKKLGEQLLYLADNMHSWPRREDIPSAEHWKDLLQHHGNVLAKLGWTEITADDVYERWDKVSASATATSEEKEEAFSLNTSDEEAALNRVKESLHWVADNNAYLWD